MERSSSQPKSERLRQLCDGLQERTQKVQEFDGCFSSTKTFLALVLKSGGGGVGGC